MVCFVERIRIKSRIIGLVWSGLVRSITLSLILVKSFLAEFAKLYHIFLEHRDMIHHC